MAGTNLDDAVLTPDDGDIKGAAPEVVDEDGLILIALEILGEGGGGGLINNADGL